MPRRFRLLLILFLLLAVGGTVWHASLPAPIGPAEGTELAGTPARPWPGKAGAAQDAAPRLRIGTFNIHGCTGVDGRRDVDRVAQCLRGLDFVALNEVHGPRLWENVDQAGQLGRRLGLPWLFAPDTRTWYHLDFGNGLLSAVPVDFWQRIVLAQRSDRGYRNAVLVGLRHGRRTIRVLLTHVTRHDDASRGGQLRAVVDLYLSLAEPAVLLGDLNSDADDPQIRRLLALPGVVDPVGQVLGRNAPRRIDWIFLRGLRAVDAGVCDCGASDHPLVWAEAEVP
ncbi:MAG: endonuclease/exonuclease/phosphatase family protein [Thermoguttaceae bacterium]|jgi:endonuclease/exonuclease/phosphatase family metal-dependent hydrolase